ncbi:hypothetical protein, partial [Neisseria sp. P0022.S010]|uniref:hypothetical protein n=1 Tax=Neisseria sp. P0022.S010 TaxID=3436835 RepID=UPI003F8126E1
GWVVGWGLCGVVLGFFGFLGGCLGGFLWLFFFGGLCGLWLLGVLVVFRCWGWVGWLVGGWLGGVWVVGGFVVSEVVVVVLFVFCCLCLGLFCLGGGVVFLVLGLGVVLLFVSVLVCFVVLVDWAFLVIVSYVVIAVGWCKMTLCLGCWD